MALKMKMMRRPRPDDAKAFVDEVGLAHEMVDPEAESFGEEFIATATSGDNAFENARDEVVEDENGLIAVLGLVDEDESEDAFPAGAGAS